MNLGAEVAQMRALAEARLPTVATVVRFGASTWDPATGTYTPPDETTIWSGPASLMAGTVGDDLNEAGRPIAGGQPVLAVPVDGTSAIMVGDTARIDGLTLTVTELDRRSRPVLRRLTCTDLTAVEEVPR